MIRSERLAVGAVAVASGVLFTALGMAACGGKLAPTEAQDAQDEYDAALAAESEAGCGPLDPELACGVDPCGNAVVPVCRPTLWVCPPIPPACSSDASTGDASSGPPGFACGSGTCPPGTFCQDPVGSVPAACIPFPSECRRTPGTPSATCACLERRAALDKVCRLNRYICPYPTRDLSAVHVGCAVD
jgi:hypothetical protein